MLVVKIGGPAYRIGMGGGAASSVPSGGREGANAADLDFNAVQVRIVLAEPEFKDLLDVSCHTDACCPAGSIGCGRYRVPSFVNTGPFRRLEPVL